MQLFSSLADMLDGIPIAKLENMRPDEVAPLLATTSHSPENQEYLASAFACYAAKKGLDIAREAYKSDDQQRMDAGLSIMIHWIGAHGYPLDGNRFETRAAKGVLGVGDEELLKLLRQQNLPRQDQLG